MQFASLGGFVPGVGGLSGIGLSAGAGRGTGNKTVSDKISGPLSAAVNDSGKKEITHAFGFDAIWELDLFGRYDRLTEAVEADTQAAFEAQ